MSFWYDKKGKSYASKGNSSWIKSYAEYLVTTLRDSFSTRLNKHVAGTDELHRAEAIIYDDTLSVKEVIESNANRIHGQVSSLETQWQTTTEELSSQIEAKASRVKVSSLETQLQTTTAGLEAQTKAVSALDTRLQEETSARETGLSQKVDKEEGKGLSSCDFTLAEKRKLSEFSSIGSFEKQIAAEDWVDGVLQIPYDEHQNSNPMVSVFCNRYDYDVYEADKVCPTSGCGGYGTMHPIHPETKEVGPFSNWFVPCEKTVNSKYYCEDCDYFWAAAEPHSYSVTQVEIICSIMVDDDNKITLQSEIPFDGKVVIK